MINNSQPKRPRKLVRGAFQPDLESALAAAVADHRARFGPLVPLTVIVPTRLLGLHLQRQLARTLPTGHVNLRFQALTDLLDPGSSTGDKPPPALASPLLLELLCRQIARQTGPYFAPVRDTPGFASALLATFTDLKEAGLTKFSAKTEKLRELAAAYAAFNDWLGVHHFQTEADLLQSPLTQQPSPTFLYGFYDLNAAQRRFIGKLAPSIVFFPIGNAYSEPLLKWFQSQDYVASASPVVPHSPSLSILSCPGEPAEIREALRAALAWLAADPARTCNDVAILCRSRDQYDALLRDTLPQLGLRAFFRGGRPLLEHPDAQLLLLLLEAIRTDFSRTAVMELACHLGPHTAWDALTVRLGIIGGQTQWRARLAAAAQLHLPNSSGLQSFIAQLFQLTARAAPTAAWSAHCDVLLNAWVALGGQHQSVLTAVRGLAELDAVSSPVEFATFAEFCQRALAGAAQQTETFQGGGIFVSDIMGARGLSFPFVVLLGMVEKSFPRVIREDPLLLDSERPALSPDLPLKLRAHDEERLLFALARGIAGEQLLLTFPRLEPANARPRVASSFLLDLDVAHHVVKLGAITGQLDERELDLAALNSLPDPAPYLEAISPLVAAGVAAEKRRWHEAKLTGHDGLFESAAALRLLRERCGLDRLVSSATALEKFFSCPFAYFQQQVLHIEEWEEPEAAMAIDPLDLGSLYHAILEDFFTTGGTDNIVTLADQHFRAFEQAGVTGFPAVWEIKKEIIRHELLTFVAREQRRLGTDWRPYKFEEEFNEVAVAPPVRLRGKIDRIDLSTDGTRARVYDYKTGRRPRGFTNDSLATGEALQLPLYLIAAERLLPNVSVESASYLYFTLRGEYSDIHFTRAALAEQRPVLTALLTTAAAMIRDGTFAQYATDETCPRCCFRPICGNGILKLAARKRDDDRLADFRAIKEPGDK